MGEFISALQEQLLKQPVFKRMANKPMPVIGTVVDVIYDNVRRAIVSYPHPLGGQTIENVKATMQSSPGYSSPVPQKGDYVLLNFQNDDPLTPVIVAIYSRDEYIRLGGTDHSRLEGL
jgi:hypothetical protein